MTECWFREGSSVLHTSSACRVSIVICFGSSPLTDSFFVPQWVLDSLGPNAERKDAKAKSGGILKRLGYKDLKLNEYEGAL